MSDLELISRQAVLDTLTKQYEVYEKAHNRTGGNAWEYMMQANVKAYIDIKRVPTVAIVKGAVKGE